MNFVARASTLLLLLTATCAGASADSPDYRLPEGIEPVSQTIKLTLDPSEATYSGTTSIRLRVTSPSDRIGINQVGLALSGIVLSTPTGQRVLQAADDDWERSWLSDGGPIEPGEYTLAIDFSGKYSTDPLGMHHAEFEGNHYVFTQMETMYARRAFPVFDEPSFKIPYRLIIEAPADLTVVANTPPESRETDDGWQRVTFLETPPLPSYLIAYAVGPLDSVALDGLSVPGQIHVPKGHAEELGFVLRHTPTIVAALEDYFGRKYPYRKLDFVAVPDFAFGAMENPGLITFRTDLLLVGDSASGKEAARVLNVITHEVAHIWYGDLVTMAWWNDLWLNEGFATWMAHKILESRFPQYETNLNLPQQSAFRSDELTTSRAIRATVRNNEEIFQNIGLNYSKGHALLRLLERYVGEETWRRGIRKYIDKHAWANATESDLWAAISEESGLAIHEIASDYLNQPGFASITIGPQGDVSQERYVREGLEVNDELWQIPLSVRYKADGSIRQTFMLLDGKSGTLDLPSRTDWIFPDAGGNGYYRWSTSREHFLNLIDDIELLTERERIALLDNTEAQLNAGSLSLLDYLYVVDRLLQDPHPLVFLPALEKIRVIGEEFVTATDRERFSAYISRALAERYRKIGMRPGDAESEAIVQMRPRLLRILGQFGNDETLLRDAAALVDQYFESSGAVQSGMALEALRVTALHSGASRYDQYVKAYLGSTWAEQRTNILAAMFFHEPDVIIRQLEFSLTPDVQAGDSLIALAFFTGFLEDHTVLYEWLGHNFDRVVAKAPSHYRPRMPQVLLGTCRQKNLDLMTDFFADRGAEYQASLAKATEILTGCLARRERHAAEFDEFLAMQDGAQ